MAAGKEGSVRIGLHESTSRTASLRNRVTALYEKHRDQVYRFLVAQGLNPPVAQEVTQDVFVDLFVTLEKGAVVESETGWLYSVAGRAAVDHWRREGRGSRVEFGLDPGVAENIASTEPSPEAQAGQVERLRRVASSLGRLPKEQRLCVHLRLQGLRYREIAKVLGVSTSTAAEWLTSAVNRVRGESQ